MTRTSTPTAKDAKAAQPARAAVDDDRGDADEAWAEIWVAEDSPVQLDRVLGLLDRAHTLSAFPDGESLLEQLYQGELPDLLLLDWDLPGVSGLDVCRFVRGLHDEVALPILMLTARTDPADIAEALAAGANDYVHKPCDSSELMARVATQLRVRKLGQALKEREERAQALTMQLQAAEREREGLIEALAAQPMHMVCVLSGPDLAFQMVNPLYREVVAHGRDVVGQSVLEALPHAREHGLDASLAQVLATGEPLISREVPRNHDRGDGVVDVNYFNTVYQPVRGKDGAFDSILVISHDVTTVVQARQAAEQQVAIQKDGLAFEQQLIGIVSHDLRNPLGAILMGAEGLLRRGTLDERAARNVATIQASAGRATRLVKDLLDFTQARLGGGLPVVRAPMDLHVVASEVADEVKENAPTRAIEVVAQGDGTGAWDADRVGQVVSNLLGNAVHYSPEGTAVTLTTRGEEAFVILEVHNLGEAIPEAVVPLLFQPMQRGPKEVGGSARSVGLGLYIVREIVARHGGSVDVVSTPATGTTFSVRLPRAG